MTADPKAPGAAAVYLYREEISDDKLHFHSLYVRMKILTEKGKEEATVHVPYNRTNFRVKDIRGRTIHPDGTVVPLTAKPSDLTDVKAPGYQRNTMVFTLPSVEVGSIIEYRLDLRYDDETVFAPTWDIQQKYFVHHAHYLFIHTSESSSRVITNSRGEALTRLMWIMHVLPGSKIKTDINDHYSFDIDDVPPVPDEDWMPPLNSLTWRIEFYYTQYTSASEFWEKEAKRWLKDADHFAEPSKALQQAVAGIVAPGDTEAIKARKLYDAVMKLDNTDFSRAKSEAERKKENLKPVRDAGDVWDQKGSSGDNLALLYVALARAAGLKAYPAQVVDRNRAIFDTSYLSTYQLDDYLAIVVVDGKEVYVDPGQKGCPFGLLSWEHALASGFRSTDKGTAWVQTPPNTYNESQISRIADLKIDKDSNVSGTVRYVMTGEEALRWRQTALRNDTDEVKKRFNESIRNELPDGVVADFDHFIGLDDPNVNLLATVKVSGNMGSVTGKRFFLPGLFFEARSKHPFVSVSKRQAPIDVEYPRSENDQVVYHLPEGYTVESAPQTTDLSWPGHALLRIRTAVVQGSIEVVRSFAFNYTLLESAQYTDLHDFYQKLATADQQQLVLTRAAATPAKGN